MPEKARFIDPMLLPRTDTLPSDAGRCAYHLKLDSYRAIAFKSRLAINRLRPMNSATGDGERRSRKLLSD